MILVYECPRCDYLDSDPEMAATHCFDKEATLW